MSGLTIDTEEVKRFLRMFTVKNTVLEIRLIRDKEQRRFFIKNVAEIDKVIDFTVFSDWNWYFGVAQRKVDATTGKKEDLASTLFLWSDIDRKILTKPKARELCVKAGVPAPSIIVYSGHGSHLYWALDSKYSLKNKKERTQLEDTQKFIAERLGGDVGTHDSTRIMRIPGTYNVKREPVVPCVVVYEGEEKYDFEQFQESVIRTQATTDFLKKYWVEDRRHNLVLAVAACLRRRKYSQQTVEDIVKKVCEAVGDSEVEDRLNAVRDTYQKPEAKIAVRKFLMQAFQDKPNPEISAEEFYTGLSKTVDGSVDEMMFASPEIRTKVDMLLEDPALLFKIKEAGLMEKSDTALINEGNNLLHLILLILAKESVEVGGLTSAGKNDLVDHALNLIPKEWWEKITGTSDKALRYLPEKLRILYVAERRGLRTGEESSAEYDMKVAISEGKLRILITEKDSEGKFKAKIKEVEIGQFILTSTDVEAPPELENRLHRMKVRDDPEQNVKVRDHILEDAEVLPWKKKDYSEDQAVIREVMTKVDAEAPENVVIKYAGELKGILETSEPRVRRNTKKILALIKACARLYYQMRPIVKGPNGERVLYSLPEDFWLVWQIGKESLIQTLSGVSEQLKEAVELCGGLYMAKQDITSRHLLDKAREEKKYSISALNTAKNRLDALERRGILAKSYDESGEIKKGKRGAYLYDYIAENGKFATYELDDSNYWSKLVERFKMRCDEEHLIVPHRMVVKNPITGQAHAMHDMPGPWKAEFSRLKPSL